MFGFFRRKPARRADFLDRCLTHLAGGHDWTFRHACESALVVGRPGSGKTSGPLHAIITGIVRSGCGAVLLGAKPGDAEGYATLARTHGRDRDVIYVGPEAHNTVNFLDGLINPKADAQTNARLLCEGVRLFSEIGGRGKGDGGRDGGRFWETNEDRLITALFEVQLMAGLRPSIRRLLQLINDLPRSPEQLRSEQWTQGVCYRTFKAAFARALANGWQDDYQALADYAFLAWPAIHQKTSSTFVAGVGGLLEQVSKGIINKVICAAEPTFTLRDAVANNKLVVCAFDYGTWQDVGRFIHAAVKHLAQKELLRRRVTADTRPVFVVADEVQNILAEPDWHFASESRGFRAGSVYCTQSISSLHAAYPDQRGRDAVNTLVGCLSTTFACLPDYETAQWIAGRCGKEWQYVDGGSRGAEGYASPWDFATGLGGPTTATWNRQLVDLLRPESLMTMRTGGPRNAFLVDCCVVQSGRVFERHPFTFTAFRQET